MSKYYSTYQFFIEMDGLSVAEFSEASGLQSDIEYDEWKEGGNNGFTHMLPKRTKWSNITIKRGLADVALWNWYSACVDGTITRRGLSIAVYQWDGSSPLRWNITAAWPIKWSGPSFKAGGSDLSFETIELAHQGWKLVGSAASSTSTGKRR